jgi:hypothetical protein
MTPKAMTSAKEASGPKNLKKILFILFNENEQTLLDFAKNLNK